MADLISPALEVLSVTPRLALVDLAEVTSKPEMFLAAFRDNETGKLVLLASTSVGSDLGMTPIEEALKKPNDMINAITSNSKYVLVHAVDNVDLLDAIGQAMSHDLNSVVASQKAAMGRGSSLITVVTIAEDAKLLWLQKNIISRTPAMYNRANSTKVGGRVALSTVADFSVVLLNELDEKIVESES